VHTGNALVFGESCVPGLLHYRKGIYLLLTSIVMG